MVLVYLIFKMIAGWCQSHRKVLLFALLFGDSTCRSVELHLELFELAELILILFVLNNVFVLIDLKKELLVLACQSILSLTKIFKPNKWGLHCYVIIFNSDSGLRFRTHHWVVVCVGCQQVLNFDHVVFIFEKSFSKCFRVIFSMLWPALIGSSWYLSRLVPGRQSEVANLGSLH